MNVPMLDLRAQYATIREQVETQMLRVCATQEFILGSEVSNLEREVAEFCGVDFAIGVSSGTDALLVSLLAVGIEPGDEVITSPYSFFATAGSILRSGARPIFVDIEPDTFNLNAAAAVAAISARTRAIVPVHLFGRCAEMALLLQAAEERRIAMIEDAAQAIGARDRHGRRAGSIGDTGCFSFFPSKNLGGFGDGGMVVTRHAELDARIRVLRVHGSRPKHHHVMLGGNFRLDALQAAVLRVKLSRLEAWSAARRRNAGRYRALFAQAGLAHAVTLPADSAGDVYNQFVVRAQERDALRDHLERRGIGTEIYYPTPLHLQPCVEHLGYAAGDFPHAERAARETLALPVYPELTVDQQSYVVEQIASFYRDGGVAERTQRVGERAPANIVP